MAYNLCGTWIGPYWLEQFLGAGAYAHAYLARYGRKGRPLAVKVPANPRESNPEFFVHEAKIHLGLHHPNIIRAVCHRMWPSPHFAMEYAAHGTLWSVLKRGVVIPLWQALKYCWDIAQALTYIHAKGIVHRDVKHNNVLLAADGTALLADFGLASSGQESAQFLLENMGAEAYRAPEADAGEALSVGDQYSLAIMVYEWLSGRRLDRRLPFDRAANWLSSSLKYTTLADCLPKVGHLADEVLLQALAKEPTDRFPNVLAFAHALQAAVAQTLTQYSAIYQSSYA